MTRLLPHSIRQRLTLWYMGILATVLLLFAGVLYASVAVSLLRDLDRAAVLEADGLSDAVAAFREAEKATEAASANWLTAPSPLLSGLEMRGQIPDLLKRWAKKTGALETEQLIRMVDRRGQALVASGGFQSVGQALEKDPVDRAAGGQTLYRTVRVGGRRMRFVTRPIIALNGRVLYLIQIAVPLEHLDVSLRELRLWLTWLIPVMLMVASVGGWFLASRALRPVDKMITQARRIGAGALDKRIDVPDTDDEMTRLAQTFNEMLARVERTFRRLRQFSAAASHELRTPLTVMKGELEVALRKPRAPEEYQRVLHAHLDAIQEMTRIVSELLTLARSEAAEEAVEWKKMDLSEIVRHESETWRKIAQDKQVRVQAQGDGPVWIRGESRLLQRLVSNLLDNAVKHTPAGGVVVLRVDHWRDKACLTVQDTGPGIPAEKLPNLFDQFFSRRPPEDGSPSTGLGLGLCRWIAEAHRGRIEAANLPGQGAAFTVWLPLHPSS